MAAGVSRHFEPAPGGCIRIRTRFEDDTGRVGHADENVEPQADILGIPWADLVAAGYGAIDEPEDGPATIRRADGQPGDPGP